MSLREHLQAIYDAHQRLTPAIVVDEARPEEHPLHSHFEWNDAVAAEAHRQEQARRLIRSVRVVRQNADGDDEPTDVRAFHAIRRDDLNSYEPIERVIADPLMTKMLLADMKREWQAMRRRYEAFQEFWTLVRADLSEAEEVA